MQIKVSLKTLFANPASEAVSQWTKVFLSDTTLQAGVFVCFSIRLWAFFFGSPRMKWPWTFTSLTGRNLDKSITIAKGDQVS